MTENVQNDQFRPQHKILLKQKIHDYLQLKNPFRVMVSLKLRLTMFGQANIFKAFLTELVAEHVLTSTLFLDPKKRRNNVKAMTCVMYILHFSFLVIVFKSFHYTFTCPVKE